MLRRILTRAALATIVAAGALLAGPSSAEQIIGLTNTNTLLSFDSATPGAGSSQIAITGLAAGEQLFDIDFRPANGQLYSLGSTGTIYTIDPTTGVALLSSVLVADPVNDTNGNGLFAGLAGTRFGIDFNPVPDRLRVVSDTGQNLRINVSTGGTITDLVLNGASSRAVSVAYTNADTNPATGTELYYIDSGSPGTLFETAAPNNGTLATVGSLGQNTDDNVGFDVSGVSGTAFTSLTVSGASSLFSVNLDTGATTSLGAVRDAGGNAVLLRGIGSRAVPEPSSIALLGLGAIGLAGYARSRRASKPVTA